MKVLFLGSGASDWMECESPYEDEYRRTASILIDDCLLVDPGPQVPDAIQTFQVDVTKIKYILCTHDHWDHFCPKTVKYLKEKGAQMIEMQEEEEIRLDGYCIKALRGNHSAKVLHYLIDDGEKCIFYGLDSAWLMYDEVQAIQNKGVDLAVMDATVGYSEGDYRVFEHNNLRMIEEMKMSLASSVKRFFISHMACTLHTDHETLKANMEKSGIEVAYDGMTVEL